MNKDSSHSNISIPSPNDFQAAFGCSASVDQDLIQICKFKDSYESILEMGFGHLDKSFSITLRKEEAIQLQLYDEHLESVFLNESDQSVEIRLKHNAITQKVSVQIYPKFNITITTF